MNTTAKHTLSMLGAVVDGLEVIQDLTKLGGEKAELALQAIDLLVTKLQAGFGDPKIDPDAILRDFAVLHDQLVTRNAEKLAKLAAKFDNSDG